MGTNYPATPELATSKTAVWWDMSDCPVPVGYDASRVRLGIEGALKKLGYSGPVSITAYGDLKQTPEHVLRRLSSSRVDLQHTAKELRCSVMYSDLLKWREHNPPPATMMLISDQVEAVFCYGLCRLQQREHGYNFVMAYSHDTRRRLLLRSTAEWLWESLLTDSETPRHVPFLRKCSETGESAMLHCTSCRFLGQSLENFTKHLSSEEHAQQETRVNQSTCPTVGPEYEKAKVMRMRKNYPAAPEFATSKTAVWWDMGDCPVPIGYDARLIRPSIEGALKKLGYSGPVSIIAYGDLKQTPEHVLRRLSSTGVNLQHTVKEVRFTFMFSELMGWVSDTPSPATMMLISNHVDTVFSFGLCLLQQQHHGYNLVVAYTHASTEASVMVTTAEWIWENLLTDSETPRQGVLNKCSETGESAMLRCTSCHLYCQSLEYFTKHLSGEKHAQRDFNMIKSTTRPSPEYFEQSKVENYTRSKRVKKEKTARREELFEKEKIKRERDTKYLSLVKREADIGISKWRRLYFHMMAQQVDTLVTSQKTETDVAPQKTMEFWGAKVAANTPFDVILGEDKLVHITQVSLDLNDCEDDIAKLFIKVGDGGRYTIGSLSLQKANHMSVDLIIDEDFILSHSLKKGNVHFTGYTTPNLEALVSEGKDKKTAGKRKARC